MADDQTTTTDPRTQHTRDDFGEQATEILPRVDAARHVLAQGFPRGPVDEGKAETINHAQVLGQDKDERVGQVLHALANGRGRLNSWLGQWPLHGLHSGLFAGGKDSWRTTAAFAHAGEKVTGAGRATESRSLGHARACP